MPSSRTSLRAALNKLFHPRSGEDGTPAAHFRSVLTAFVGLGFQIGVWAVLLADLAASLALSPRSLGVALSVMTASGMATLFVGGRLVDRFGRRPFLLLGVSGAAVFFLLLVLVSGSGGYAALLTVLVFGGVCSTFWELAVNTLGGDHEHRHGGHAMTSLHAGFSGGAALGAFLTGVALWAGVEFGVVYALVAAVLLLLAAVLGFVPLPRREPEVSNEAQPGVSNEAEPLGSGVAGASLLLVPAVAACALILFMAFFTDAALEAFLSIYLRDTLSSGVLLGGTGVAAFHLATCVARLGGAAVLRRISERATLTACGLALAFGMACVVLVGSPALAAVALLVVGVAAAPIAPVVFSRTARAVPAASARALSMVTICGSVAFLVGPPILGAIADISSLRVSLLLPVAFGVGVAVVAGLLPPLAKRKANGKSPD